MTALRFICLARLAIAFLPGLAPIARAEERVWVINSDRSIERYRQAEDAFKETWNAPTMDIDLGRLSLNQDEVDRRAASTPPSTVYCIGSKAYLLADQELKNRAIVMSSAIHWQRFPARENRWVIASEVPAGSQLTLFSYVFPRVRRIGILCSRKYSEQWVNDAIQDSKDSSIRIDARFVEKSSESHAALRDLLAKVDALWLVADPTVLSSVDAVRDIFKQAAEAMKPVFANSPAFAEMGAVLIVEPDSATVGRQAAGLIRTLGKNEPADTLLKPAGTTITLNLRVVSELGLELNEQALDSVNHIER